MSTQNRVPPGLPTGGQFAPSTRPESDVALGAWGRALPVDHGAVPDGVVDCPTCGGPSAWSAICHTCGGDGLLTQPEMDEVAGPDDYAGPPAWDSSQDSSNEPDFEAMAEARAEEAHERYGAAAEWGGMNVPS